MNYLEQKRREYLEKVAISFPSVSRGIKGITEGRGIRASDLVAAAVAGSVVLPVVHSTFQNLSSPTTKVWGDAIADRLTNRDRRLGLTDSAAIAEAQSRGKALGLENAQDIIAERAKKRLAKKEEEVLGPARDNLLKSLKAEDPLIRRGLETAKTKNLINDTFTTVKTFAPTLATDKKTMQAVLREALTTPEGGLSYQTIRQLADTQRSINESADTNTIYSL